MWNKQQNQAQPEPARHDPTPAAPPPQPVAAAPQPVPQVRKQPAVIGPSMSIKGDIHAREELLVDGEVEGTINRRARSQWARTAK